MPPPPRKIANRYVNGPQRYRPGKPAAAEVSSEEEDKDEEEQQDEPPRPPKPAASKPAASSFPKAAFKPPESQINEEDFETEESGEEVSGEGEREDSASGTSEDGDEDSSEEEESSSDDDAARRRVMMRPMFVRKEKRSGEAAGVNGSSTASGQPADRQLADEAVRRKERADELIQEQIERNAAERTAGKKFWNDEDVELVDDIDDTDDLDPEAELTAWKLRELKRVKRDREALIAAEKEREEVDRRRNLGEDERNAEDAEFLARQQEERDSRNKMDYMQKYYHKGAFFQDDAKAMGLDKRDVMGSRFENQVDRSVLPEYLQVRDMTRVGRKGRTKYKDMRTEDTGRWGDFRDGRRSGGYSGQDDRFMADRERESGAERTGANASALGERKRHFDEDSREGKRPRVDS